MASHLLECDTLRMTKEKKIECLGQRSELNLQIAIVGEEESIVVSDAQTTWFLALQKALADGARTESTPAKLNKAVVYLIQKAPCVFIDALIRSLSRW